MYKKVLVPMDGSELAESVLPHVETVIGGCGVEELVFVRVVEPVMYPIGTTTDGGAVFTEADAEKARRSIDAGNEQEAKDYLTKIVERYDSSNVKVRQALLKGKPADKLIDYIDESGADLVIIASHGRSGIGRWIHGSVAERLLRSICIPVLMVRVPGCVTGF
jgi:nucleotide-binding universal stress UspA family protein